MPHVYTQEINPVQSYENVLCCKEIKLIIETLNLKKKTLSSHKHLNFITPSIQKMVKLT